MDGEILPPGIRQDAGDFTRWKRGLLPNGKKFPIGTFVMHASVYRLFFGSVFH